MHNQTVETVMTANVLSVRPSPLVAEISALLIHHKINAVPVLDTGRPLADRCSCAAPPNSFTAWRQRSPASLPCTIPTYEIGD